LPTPTLIHQVELAEKIRRYQGKGIYCGLWKEVSNYPQPFYTLPDDHICAGGTSYTGMGQKDLPPKLVEHGWNMLVGEGKIYYSRESVTKCQESVPFSFKNLSHQKI
jgi:uncharacterized protein (DUF169 family)